MYVTRNYYEFFHSYKEGRCLWINFHAVNYIVATAQHSAAQVLFTYLKGTN